MASARPQERDFKAARDLSCIENWRLQHIFFLVLKMMKKGTLELFSALMRFGKERRLEWWECLLFYLPLFTTWHSAMSLRKPVKKIEQIKVRQYSYSRGRWRAACHTVSGRLVYPPEAAAYEYTSCLGLNSLLPMNQKTYRCRCTHFLQGLKNNPFPTGNSISFITHRPLS